MNKSSAREIASFDMGFATVKGHAAVSTIKFSFENDTSECFVVLPRPVAMQLMDLLLAYAERCIVGQVDSSDFDERLVEVEGHVVRRRPEMTRDEATDPPLSAYVRSVEAHDGNDRLALHLEFSDQRQEVLTIDGWRAAVLLGYMNNVIQVADEGGLSAPMSAKH